MNTSTRVMMITLCILSARLLSGCVSDAPFKIQGSAVPDLLGDGWDVGAPEDVGISQATLDRIYSDFVSEDKHLNAKSLLVAKSGKLVFEAYCRRAEDRDRYGHVQSVTKSITSLVFGIVQSDGYIDSLDQTLYSIIPDKFPPETEKHGITLRHLLTMTSGLSFDNDDFSVEVYADKPDDPVKYILNKPLCARPGERFYYRDADPHLLSYAIQRLTGRTLARWAEDRLFAPLNISDYYWGSDHTGTSMGGHGVHLKPRDLAKIGQLVVDHGRWMGVEVVDSTWIAVSTERQVVTPFTTEPHVYYYGFYWWILPRWHAFSAWGAGGNYIFVVPAKRMVVVMTSMPDVDNEVMNANLMSFEELISPLLED